MKLADSSAESDSEMNLEPFYNTIVKKVNITIYSLRDIRKYISLDIAIQIYEETILPFFDCGVFVSITLSKDKKKELQILQNNILLIRKKS